MDWDKLAAHWQKALDACALHGGEPRELVIKGPATQKEIAEIEGEIGALPTSLRETLLNFSKEVSVFWTMTDDRHALFEDWGYIEWSLGTILETERSRKESGAEVLKYYGPEAGDLWDKKFGFTTLGNGDILSIDIAQRWRQPVAYLDHVSSEEVLGWEMAKDFQDFLIRHAELGCIGPEHWALEPFSNNCTTHINPRCENAETWKKFLFRTGD